jgi:hypothetical protein
MKIAVFWDMMLHRLVKSTDVQGIMLPSLSVLMLEVVGSPEIRNVSTLLADYMAIPSRRQASSTLCLLHL